MKITRMLLVVASLVASGFVVSFQAPVEAQSVEAFTCADRTIPCMMACMASRPRFRPTPGHLWRRHNHLVATYEGGGTVPGSTMALWMNSEIVSQTSFPGEINYTFSEDTTLPPGGDPVLGWEALDANQYGFYASWDVSCSSAGAGGQTINGVPVPGCDMRMRLTSDAAVGMFVTDTHVLWGPRC